MPAALQSPTPPYPATNRPSAGLFSPRCLFILGTLLGLLALTLAPHIRAMLGLFDLGHWFLDSYAVLASSDAARAGNIDPDAPNPYDVFHRRNSYSDWWYGLGKLGLTRADNFLVGGVWVLAFLVVVFLTVQPRGRDEAAWLVLLTCSPPVMLALMRANNDLVIFAVLAVAVLPQRDGSVWRLALALAAVALATGLKFYPVAAGFVFLLLPSSKRLLLVAGLAALMLAAVLAAVGSQVLRGNFPIGTEPYIMGGRIWFMDLGLARQQALLASITLLGAGAVWAVSVGLTSGLARENSPPAARQAMTMASAMLVICFLGTVNHSYRWIFALWLAPWLWHQRSESTAARVTVWLLPAILWHDGILCLATSLWFPALRPEQYDHILLLWQLATEPLTWLVMIFLAGWLLDLVLTRGREVRAEFFPPVRRG
jgi:hypothetical protein